MLFYSVVGLVMGCVSAQGQSEPRRLASHGTFVQDSAIYKGTGGYGGSTKSGGGGGGSKSGAGSKQGCGTTRFKMEDREKLCKPLVGEDRGSKHDYSGSQSDYAGSGDFAECNWEDDDYLGLAAQIGQAGAASKSYRGCQIRTRSGYMCDSWLRSNSDFKPWSETQRCDGNIAHARPEAGLCNNNFCRNPDDSQTIWCYVAWEEGVPRDLDWEYCDPVKGVFEKMKIISDMNQPGFWEYQAGSHTKFGRSTESEATSGLEAYVIAAVLAALLFAATAAVLLVKKAKRVYEPFAEDEPNLPA